MPVDCIKRFTVSQDPSPWRRTMSRPGRGSRTSMTFMTTVCWVLAASLSRWRLWPAPCPPSPPPWAPPSPGPTPTGRASSSPRPWLPPTLPTLQHTLNTMVRPLQLQCLQYQAIPLQLLQHMELEPTDRAFQPNNMKLWSLCVLISKCSLQCC